jgi:hypothetical protein
MPDIPKIKTSKLAARLAAYHGAAAAVRAGIATHAEKHRALQHKQREELAAARKLQEGK